MYPSFGGSRRQNPAAPLGPYYRHPVCPQTLRCCLIESVGFWRMLPNNWFIHLPLRW